MLYVTGDTHGDYERFTSSALKKLKNKLGFWKKRESSTVFAIRECRFILQQEVLKSRYKRTRENSLNLLCKEDSTHQQVHLWLTVNVCWLSEDLMKLFKGIKTGNFWIYG